MNKLEPKAIKGYPLQIISKPSIEASFANFEASHALGTKRGTAIRTIDIGKNQLFKKNLAIKSETE